MLFAGGDEAESSISGLDTSSSSSSSSNRNQAVQATAQPSLPSSTKARSQPHNAKAKPPAGPRAGKKLAAKAAVSPAEIPADARSKAAYKAMEELLEHGAQSNSALLQSIACLSGEEFLQVSSACHCQKCLLLHGFQQLCATWPGFVKHSFTNVQIAEERSLAGLCGNPRCCNELPCRKASAHYKINGRVVWDIHEEQQLTCRYVCCCCCRHCCCLLAAWLLFMFMIC